MTGFVWQDTIALAGALYGAMQSSRIVPGFPSHIYLARFLNGFHVTAIVVIYGAFTTPAVNLMKEVAWVKNIFNFYMPLIGYTVIVLMGMNWLFVSVLQTLLANIHKKKGAFFIVASIMGFLDLFVLIHIMCLF